MKIQMCCTSAQPTASSDGATAGGARVTLTETVTSGHPSKGARLELFLDAAHKNDVRLGQNYVVTIA